MNLQEKFIHVPPPFLLNIWKHHVGAIRSAIRAVHSRKLPLDSAATLATIGGNVLDVYYGPLSPGEITGQIQWELLQKNALDRSAFLRWLGSAEFGMLTLSDGSHWILRFGRDHERYIHLHPGRNSPDTARFNSNTWKTAVALYYRFPDEDPFDDLVRLNLVRVELGLSPLARIGRGSLGAAIGVMFGIARGANGEPA